MPYIDPTVTPKNAVLPPGMIAGQIIQKIPSDHCLQGQLQPPEPDPAPSHPVDDNLRTVPQHHNEDSLCCLCGSPFQMAVTCGSFLCCFPLCWGKSLRRLTGRQEAAVYLCGQPYAHIGSTEQQWLCINPFLDVLEYSKNFKMVNLDEVKAADADGSPIVLSGVVTYTVGDPWRFFASGNVTEWVRNQGLVVMKEVASRYPYDASPGQVSLRTRGSRNNVVNSLRTEMQQRVGNVGLSIRSFELTDMHYAKEVAAQMLVTQQAKATVNARRLIVDGAVGIVTETVGKLEGVGINFNAQQKADLVRSLLVMSVSDAPAQATVTV